MKILLGDFNVKIGIEDIFKPKLGMNVYMKLSNDNGVRVVNFITFKNLIVKSAKFPHHNIKTIYLSFQIRKATIRTIFL
jgi:hypothetical protein